MTTPQRVVGQRIKQRLSEIGMSQTELAAELGLPRGTVARWANGRHLPRTPNEWAALVRVLKTSEAWLRGLDDGDRASRQAMRVAERPFRRLPPSVYAVLHECLEQAEKAGLAGQDVDEIERFLTDAAYSPLGEIRSVRTDADVIADLRAAWRFVRAVLTRQGIRLGGEPIETEWTDEPEPLAAEEKRVGTSRKR